MIISNQLRSFIILAAFVILLSGVSLANEPLKPTRIETPPVIDGILDESFWNQSPKVSGFKTFIPDFDIIPKEQTEVLLAYDSANLYFAFRCFDEPDKIKASVSARDKMIGDDFICINLDAFNDQQGLNAFYVNAFGIQGDSKFAAGNEDFSPDYVWYSAGKINSDGYTVEVQLPLKSLRYRNDEPTVMGVILERSISRRSEHSCFPRLDPAKGFALLTQMYPLEYSGIEHYTLLEILPAITATRQDVRESTNLVRGKQEAEVSLNVKYGLTSDLILDGTINPDFSQVESDAGQVDVNLRSRLFNSEKRSFFLEGQDNFNLAVSANSFDPMMFYSRTIVEPLLGTKLTGKVGQYNTLAALYAIDNVLEQDQPTLGNYIHVPVLRFKSALSDD
ncbi:MAG: carbohydrate binding family 9 domain-containing protein, partial [Ignavibacteriae bacterium]|nr:carbohydrate binding family 9 domain-containing protein [Ignavibacteriota bacterium]